jgi:hypothetical protein
LPEITSWKVKFCINGRADPSARVPLDPLSPEESNPAQPEEPAIGPAADQGVRPTIYADVP